MTDNKIAVFIMAAGKGTRMKSDLPKVLHKLNDRAMIHYVLDTARKINADPIVMIVGHQKELLQDELKDAQVRFTAQEPQLGTGHAVMCALKQAEDCSGAVLILSGDVPLITSQALSKLFEQHRNTGAAATVLTAIAENPHGYGRVVRQASGNLDAIVEERDANDEIRKIREINSGIYIFAIEDLRRVLPKISDDNDQKEYYLTDAVRILTDEGKFVGAAQGSIKEVMGINTVDELEEASRLIQ